jgi:hypothetical protein
MVNSSLYNMLVRLRRFEWINRLLLQAGLVENGAPQDLLVYKKEITGLQEGFWDATAAAIHSIHELAKKNNARLLIMYIPDKFQVDDQHWQAWLAKYRIPAEDYDIQKPNKWLKSYCETNRIDFLDTTDSLRNTLYQTRISPYWRIDHHLNKTGHEVVARVFLRWFKSLPARA